MRILDPYDPKWYGMFQTLYIDPSWEYTVYNEDTGQGRSAESHYSTMNILDIARALPIDRLAAKSSVLLMWVTAPQKKNAFEILRMWGFEYKTTAFWWIKTRAPNSLHMGMGFTTRQNPEEVWLATRKKWPKRQDMSVDSVCISPLMEHSRKPEEIRRRIMRLWPDGPFFEGFSRAHPAGWHVWGNEAPDEEQVLPMDVVLEQEGLL